MKLYRSKANGLTFISIVVILLVVAFFTLLILKIGPIYYDNYLVKQAVAKLKNDPGALEMSKRQVRSGIEKRFDVSYVKDVNARDAIITKRGNHYLKLELEYEVVENIVGNLDVLVTFKEGFELGDR
ncbi:MAG: DUF4845 domain-containing protein [Gammaproteobacteria bacterium]|nr:DUF4845 domain-containing protein [Gammaproteobacteria bacterium]